MTTRDQEEVRVEVQDLYMRASLDGNTHTEDSQEYCQRIGWNHDFYEGMNYVHMAKGPKVESFRDRLCDASSSLRAHFHILSLPATIRKDIARGIAGG